MTHGENATGACLPHGERGGFAGARREGGAGS